MMRKRVLITGGCGFIGHHMVEACLRETDWEIVVWDKLTYASNGLDRLRDINCFDEGRVAVLTVDISEPFSPGVLKETGAVDYIVHMAAETHVDRSIEDAEPFVRSNVLGTMRMLDYARSLNNLKKMIYFSTDEVFGPAPAGVEYKEWDRYNSSNPYAATKAGGEELCLAYANTYGLPLLITHCMNIVGERQHKEKYLPLCIRKILAGELLSVHADATCTQSGSRYWIHARNVADAVLFLLNNGQQREKYNIVGEERSNLQMAEFTASVLAKSLKYELVSFHATRLGHDLRYALDGTNMKQMGWKVPRTLEQSLAKMIRWTLENPQWLT